jgi:hypothetical protein
LLRSPQTPERLNTDGALYDWTTHRPLSRVHRESGTPAAVRRIAQGIRKGPTSVRVLEQAFTDLVMRLVVLQLEGQTALGLEREIRLRASDVVWSPITGL